MTFCLDWPEGTIVVIVGVCFLETGRPELFSCFSTSLTCSQMVVVMVLCSRERDGKWVSGTCALECTLAACTTIILTHGHISVRAQSLQNTARAGLSLIRKKKFILFLLIPFLPPK